MTQMTRGIVEQTGGALAPAIGPRRLQTGRATWPLLDPPRLRQLCEISNLLIGSGTAETTLPAVVALIDQILPLRSAVFILCDRVPVWIVWSRAGESDGQLQAERAGAQGYYDYFMGAEVTPPRQRPVGRESWEQDSLGSVVRLPLVVARNGSLGLVQLQGTSKLGERDLAFVSAVTAQLALALNRQLITERQRNIAERRRSDAVEHQIQAEARQACAEAEAQAAKAARLRTELALATAEALQRQVERQRMIAEDMRDRYRALVDDAEGAFLWEADADTLRMSYVSAGAEELLGYSRLRWLAEPGFLLERVHADERSAMERLLRSVTGGVGQRCEHRFVGDDGRAVWFLTGVHRARDGSSAVLQGVSLQLPGDPTAARLAELEPASGTQQRSREHVEEGQGTAEARDELLAVVSHDLKSPLNVILMTVERMAAAPSNDSVAVGLKNIQRSAQQMHSLVRDLLDSAQLEAGRLLIDARPVAPAALIDDAIAAVLPLARAKSLQLESAFSGKLPNVKADAHRIQQVLVNLIGNAIKFSEPGGDILVRAERAGEAVRFAVRDIGSGIPSSDVPRLFERFWQAARTARQGTGLGLSIARGIVVAHGGRIWAQSRVGVGSTFYFTLPSA